MAFPWSSFRLPRDDIDHTPVLPVDGGQPLGSSTPMFPLDGRHAVGDDRSEADADLDDVVTGDVDMLRQMHERLLRAWSQVSPDRWEQEVQAVSERFRADMPGRQVSGGQNAVADGGRRDATGVQDTAFVVSEPVNMGLEGAPIHMVIREGGHSQRPVNYCQNDVLPVTSIPRYSRLHSANTPERGPFGFGGTSAAGPDYFEFAGARSGFGSHSGAPDVMTSVRQAAASCVGQVPFVSMVTQPTNTYTWQRPVMSYFATDSQVRSSGHTPMAEETSLHGRIWLPVSQPAAREGYSEDFRAGRQREPQVHWGSWNMVSEDRPSSRILDHRWYPSEAERGLERDPGLNPHWQDGNVREDRPSSGILDPRWYPNDADRGLGRDPGLNPHWQDGNVRGSGPGCATVPSVSDFSRPYVSEASTPVRSIGAWPDRDYQCIFESGVQWALNQCRPVAGDPQGHNVNVTSVSGSASGVTGGPIESPTGSREMRAAAGLISRRKPETSALQWRVPDQPVGASRLGTVGSPILGGQSVQSTVTGGQDNTEGGISSAVGGRPGKSQRSQPKKVAKYDGKSSWADYLVQFDIAAQLNDWDESQKAMELATSLDGAARGVLADVTPQNRLNFQVLVDKLAQRFEPEGQTATYQSQLQSRKRRRNESIPELVQEISRITRKAYPAADSQTRDALAVSSFISALGNEAQQLFVYQKDPRTLEDAGKAALGYETFQAAVSKETSYVRTQHVVKDTGEPPAWAREWMSRIDKLEKRLQQGTPQQGRHRGPTSSNGDTGSRRRGACFHCGSEEHFIRQCPSRGPSRVDQVAPQAQPIAAQTTVGDSAQSTANETQTSSGNQQ